MTATQVTFGGAANSNSWANTLFKRTFGGEILTEFREATVFRDKQFTRTITEGKSAKFPVFGRSAHAYFTPGEDIYEDTGTTNIRRNERLIVVNDLCLSATFVDQLDEMKDDYTGIRGIYAKEMGRVLANNYDQMVARSIIAASAGAAVVTGGPTPGGNIDVSTNDAAVATVAANWVAGIFAAAQAFDEQDVPKEGRWCAVKPVDYYKIVQSTVVSNRDYGGTGDVAKGLIPQVAGINIVMSNHIPTTDESGGITGNRNAALDMSYLTTVGCAWHESAVGTVSLMDLAFESEYDIVRQGYLMVAKMAVGHGILRPEAAIQFTETA